MAKWEYRTITIKYDKKSKNWTYALADTPPLVGLQAVLEAHGARGWELVSLYPDHLEVFPGFGKWYIEPAAYRATFKRPE